MKSKAFFLSLILLGTAACSSIVLQPADYSWPIENVLKVDDFGFVSETRYTFKINVKNLYTEEFKDSTAFTGKELRLIRDVKGYYYATGNDFKNVYVLMTQENGMKVEKIIPVSLTGLKSPIMNQKNNSIELIDNGLKTYFTNKGIEGK
ncbi:MAG: hypothetical protein WC055_08770 [Melioribacteraceae bacterium]